jgi:hypothetical protein
MAFAQLHDVAGLLVVQDGLPMLLQKAINSAELAVEIPKS